MPPTPYIIIIIHHKSSYKSSYPHTYYVCQGKVRAQDRMRLFGGLIGTMVGQETAWAYLKDNQKDIMRALGGPSAALFHRILQVRDGGTGLGTGLSTGLGRGVVYGWGYGHVVRAWVRACYTGMLYGPGHGHWVRAGGRG